VQLGVVGVTGKFPAAEKREESSTANRFHEAVGVVGEETAIEMSAEFGENVDGDGQAHEATGRVHSLESRHDALEAEWMSLFPWVWLAVEQVMKSNTIDVELDRGETKM